MSTREARRHFGGCAHAIETRSERRAQLRSIPSLVRRESCLRRNGWYDRAASQVARATLARSPRVSRQTSDRSVASNDRRPRMPNVRSRPQSRNMPDTAAPLPYRRNPISSRDDGRSNALGVPHRTCSRKAARFAFDLARALNAVVALRVEVPEDAFTASILGTERTGNGVVINDDGLVLTIGYLITEAETIWLTTHSGNVVPGHALAYDQVTGLGLVLPLGKLDAAPDSAHRPRIRRSRRRRVRHRPRRARPCAQGARLRAARVRRLLGIPARRGAVHDAAASGVERRGAARRATAG